MARLVRFSHTTKNLDKRITSDYARFIQLSGFRDRVEVPKPTFNGYYNIERILKLLAAKGAPIGVCGSCMDARGIRPEMLAEGAHRSSMAELTSWTEAASKVLVF